MLSKMAKPQEPLTEKEPLTKYNYSYKEIAKKDLSKCKVVELKALAKTLDIRVSGNKDELRIRIATHIKHSASAIRVQSWIRRKLVYMWIGLKGSKKDCVNDTDFYTLEPIDEIPFLYYMQYTGSNVKYGFNILSLCSLAVKNKSFENPYTRENMRHTIANEMGKIIRLTNVLFPGNELMEQIKSLYEGKDSSNVLHGLLAQTHATVRQRNYNPIFTRLESLPMEQRITELFMAIDSLGNYTKKEWLTRMTVVQIRYAIVKVYNVWQRIPLELRTRICLLMSPFNRQIMPNLNGDLTQQEALEYIVKMAEILVYSAQQREDRVMGAMYFLIGLTMASPDARESLPWLYESYYDIMNNRTR
jgi:hypothetical protein